MSIVVRKSLGRQLKALREAAGITPTKVAALKIASTSKLHRIETGEVGVRLETVWALSDLYGADRESRSRLSSLALNTAENGWWEGFSDLIVTPRFGTYVELESAAHELLAWDGELVHGLLQTTDYTAALFAANPYPTSSDEDRDRQIAFRQERQRAVLERAEPVRISVVLGAGVLLRKVGGDDVMAGQTAHLLELARRENVDLRILGWDVGAHTVMTSSLTVLGFVQDDVPDVVYVESILGGRYEEDPRIVTLQRQNFARLLELATPIEEYLR